MSSMTKTLTVHVGNPPALRRAAGAGLGWIPAGLVAIVATVVLHVSGVELGRQAVFAGYIVLGICVPGTLVWRFLRGKAGFLAGDLAAGTALGYGMEVMTYIPARWLGVPLLVLAWPLITIGAFALVPGLRRHWRGSGRRMPAGCAWTVAGAVASMTVFSGAWFFRGNGLSWPFNAAPNWDLPYHLALIGELRHHMPPSYSPVAGEPLLYHWFFYAEAAATSWVTGIEPQVLLYRLAILPMLAGILVLLAVLGQRLSGRWWAGGLAVVICWCVFPPNPSPWLPNRPIADGALSSFLSPTQVFATFLFTALALVLVDLLSGRAAGRKDWALFALLVFTVAGAKATFLPLLLAGLLFALALTALRARRLDRSALIALGITLAGLCFAQVVLYGGSSNGMTLAPGSGVLWMEIFTETPGSGSAGIALTVTVLAICLLTWICVWSGAIGLFAPPRGLPEPGVLVFAGMGLAAFCGVVLLGHPGFSQQFLLGSVRPYLSVLAACGIAAMVPARHIRWLLVPAAAGLLTVWAVRLLNGALLGKTSGVDSVLLPYVVLAGAAALVFLLLLETVTPLRRVRPAAALTMVTAIGVAPWLTMMTGTSAAAVAADWRQVRPEAAAIEIPDGGVRAARWLRDHSSPGDLVATNAHCLRWGREDGCNARHFWIAAYAERRMLVEGWSFTPRKEGATAPVPGSNLYVPYWDPARLAANDAAFATPSAATVGRLRGEYRVRWLFADESAGRTSAALQHHAQLRFRAGSCAVYEVRPR